MSLNLRDWQLRARALFARRRVERELDEELSFHIEREVQKLLGEGLSAAEAQAAARARFGSVPRAADECRDARGTALVDNTIRDIVYALRGFVRTPLVAFTVVATVGLGLGLVAAAFTILNLFLFRVDRVPGVQQMFRVERPQTADGEPTRFTRAQLEALRRETAVFTDVYAEVPEIDTRVDGRLLTGSLVTGNFAQVVGVAAALGRTLTPADDEAPGGRQVLLLSHRGWDRMFASDPAILGRRVLINDVAFEIVGVMPEGFRGLSVGAPDYWAPLAAAGDVLPKQRGREAEIGVDIIGRLRPGMSKQRARAELAIWDISQPSRREASGKVSDIVLAPKQGTVPQPLEAVLMVAPLFFAFGLILLIGCANVTNLLLARAVARQREIGIRLSLGATRRRIIRQLLTESLLLALAAAALGLVISRGVLVVIINAVLTSMPAGIGDIRLLVPDADWRVILFLLAGAGVSTMFFGLTPALQATRIETVRTIRGEVIRDARPGRARNILIGLQVSASALLLICAAVFLRSTFAAATEDPGLRTTDTVIVRIENEPARLGIVQAITDEPTVSTVAASWPGAISPARPAFADASGGKVAVGYRLVSPEFFSVLDIAIVRGRAFMPEERTPNLAVALVSETAARALWPNREAIGQVLHLDPNDDAEKPKADDPRLESRAFTVVGVVEDVAGFRISPLEPAIVYVPTSAAMPKASLIARVHGDPERARQSLLTRLTNIDPAMGDNEHVGTMLWVTRMLTWFLQLAFWFTVVLGGLALALTLSGLFSVLSYVVERRTREIGIRMAIGATAPDVTRLVLSQTVRPVVIGLVVGTMAAAGLAALLLAIPDAGGLGEVVRVFDPVAYAVSLGIIIAACLVAASIPASRAARLDPNKALRQE